MTMESSETGLHCGGAVGSTATSQKEGPKVCICMGFLQFLVPVCECCLCQTER